MVAMITGEAPAGHLRRDAAHAVVARSNSREGERPVPMVRCLDEAAG